MHQPPDGFAVALETRCRREFRDSSLVLDSAKIPYRVARDSGAWILIVHDSMYDMAHTEIGSYREENPRKHAQPSVSGPLFGNSIPGILIYAVALILVGAMAIASYFGADWFDRGRASAELIKNGEWWRTITALTLHSDLGHLAGNILFGSIYGAFVSRSFGSGIAWLGIALSGILGNALNALMRTSHDSIGASTAVFGALGILAIHTFLIERHAEQTRFRKWSPLIAAIALFGFLGVGGERTDVGAHLMGFVCGLAIGACGCRMPKHWVRSLAVQLVCGAVVILVFAIAWWKAVSY